MPRAGRCWAAALPAGVEHKPVGGGRASAHHDACTWETGPPLDSTHCSRDEWQTAITKERGARGCARGKRWAAPPTAAGWAPRRAPARAPSNRAHAESPCRHQQSCLLRQPGPTASTAAPNTPCSACRRAGWTAGERKCPHSHKAAARCARGGLKRSKERWKRGERQADVVRSDVVLVHPLHDRRLL